MNTMRFSQELHAGSLCAFLSTVDLDPVSATATAHEVCKQGPGFCRVTLGDFEVTALLDGTHPFPVDTVMTHISKDEIANDLARDNLTLPIQGSINAFLIDTGSKLILIDSGAGVLYGDCCGHLMNNLRAAGYDPNRIDEVLLTHLHKDHVGGVITEGKMTFPNAILRVSQTDADYWFSPENKAEAPMFLNTFFDSAIASVAPYQRAEHIKTFSGNQQLEPGILGVATQGHTPGHTSYVIRSGAQVFLVWGDIIHVASIQLRHPSASVEYDSDAQAAQRSRRELLQLAASKNLLVGAAHISFPGLGHIRVNGDAYDWVPVNHDSEPGKQ